MEKDSRQQSAAGESLRPADLELVRQARGGDMAAFHLLVDRHAESLYRLAVSLVGNAHDAEDALQETLAGAFRGLAAFREQSSVKTWLAGILVRQVARHFRRGWFGRKNVELEKAPEPAGGPPSATSDVRMDVQAAILALPPQPREVIVLRELQGFSYEEIAQVLGVPGGTVESRLHRARLALRELLKDYV